MLRRPQQPKVHLNSKTVPKHQLVLIYRQAVAAGLPIEMVHQKIQTFADRFQLTVNVEEQDDQKKLRTLQHSMPLKTRLLVHVLPVGCLLVGMFLLTNAVWPILSYFVFSSPDLFSTQLKAPVPNSFVLDPQRALANALQAQAATIEAQPSPTPVMLTEDLDYTNLTNWFPHAAGDQTRELELAQSDSSDEYVLNIPAVNIEDAHVKVGGMNLDKSLIQYPGTALPGDPGSPVIFGHSVLRQFYNPSTKNSRRYMSIFSKIMTLKQGDKIYIEHKGVKYSYTVQEKIEVKPEDTYILEQNYQQKTLKMITCVPEGTFLRRGVVMAQLDE
jgi:LPXTG-site transpeptidase (sortase) family protein